MSGIVGFTSTKLNESEKLKVLVKMQDLITHEPFFIKDKLFHDKNVCAARSHSNTIQKVPQPYSDSGIYIWLDGEFYNRDQLNHKANISADNDPALLLGLFKQHNDFSFLGEIDGFYSAVIYDAPKRKIHLIPDRYGLRFLFWADMNGHLAWASELKAFLALPYFRPEIDKRAVEEFVEIGYMLEDRSWFEGVRLLSPGTVLTWDIEAQSGHLHRYWWWDRIKPLSGKIREDEIAEELGRLFTDSVKRRCGGDERIGLFLSGGLDSRAMLAAMPEHAKPIHAVTFGKKGCNDIRFAEMAAKVKGAFLHTFEINEKNWLMPRLQGIWLSDGHINLLHMHGIEENETITGIFRTHLNSVASNPIRGCYLQKFTDRKSLACYLGCNPELINNYDDYSQLGTTDFYILQNKVRRHTYGANYLQTIEVRNPFYDNKFMEFNYSLPDALRFKSRIFKKMFLKTFPVFYKKIPWQKTGTPISWPDTLVNAFQFPRTVKSELFRVLSRFGFKYNNPKSYTDYPNWIRQDPARSFFESMLTNQKALYTEYIPEERVHNKLIKHLSGENHAEVLCRYLTFELWLQQVFEGKYRNAAFIRE
jgi:asparagine synthase (glutamine-hydrolysing)